MALMVAGLVVTHSELMRGACGGVLPMMEPTQPNTLQEQKKIKTEIKRDKNRESSARSRQRKKEEDDHNLREVERLERENEELRKREKIILQEGRELVSQVDAYFYSNPRCSGCPEEFVENEPRDASPPPHLFAPPPPTDFMEHS